MEQSAISLERMQVFVRIVERGSFSAVARETGAGHATITRRLRELEEALGISLLTRTTRKVSLTKEGERYYERCIRILALVDEATQEAQMAHRGHSGSLRISCTAALGVRHVQRIILEFQERYPEIRIAFNLTDERVDLVQDGIDLAIRLGALTDSTMKRRFLGESQRILVASPQWLACNGPITGPEDLRGKEGIRLSCVRGSERIVLMRDGVETIAPVQGRLTVDHGLALREGLLAGRGFGAIHLWLGEDCLEDGRLCRILPDYGVPSQPLNMLISPERVGVARVRLCADFLAEHIACIPGIG